MPDIKYDITPVVVYDYDTRKTNAFLDDYIQRYNKFHGGNYTDKIKKAFQNGRYNLINDLDGVSGMTMSNTGDISIKKSALNSHWEASEPGTARGTLSHELEHRIRSPRWNGFGLGTSKKERKLLRKAYNLNLRGYSPIMRVLNPIFGFKNDERFALNTGTRAMLQDRALDAGIPLNEYIQNLSNKDLINALRVTPYFDPDSYVRKNLPDQINDVNELYDQAKIDLIKRALIEVAKTE